MTEGARKQGRGAGGINTRASVWLAWSVCALSLVLTALGLLFLALNRSHPGVPVFEFAFRSTVIVASCSSVGVIIASRRPAHPIGWLFSAVGLLSGLHLFCGEYAIYALVVERGSLLGGRVSAWTIGWLWVTINALLAFVALLFPDGRLPSPRWRPVGWLNVVMAVVGSSVAASLPGPSPWLPAIDNPFGVEGLKDIKNLLDASLEALSYGILLAGVVSLYFRYRRAGQAERQQIKWLAYAGAVLLTGTILLNVGPDSLDWLWIRQVGFALWVIGFVGVPIAIGIAIFRYRLYEIDIIINRTLVYGALTVVLAIIFQSIDATLHYLLVTLVHLHSLPESIIAALVVAALFDPIKHRIQHFVNGYLPSGESGRPGHSEESNPS
ncbi:MAG TPA: hypothetical protein VFI90_02765 [Rubrobacter sp.]|nr:hypothetical protein [Rubrobacter sp.]